MRTIRLRFVTQADLLSWAIRWRTLGLFSHVGAMTEDDQYEIGARLAVDRAVSARPGVQMRPHDYRPFSRVEFVEIPCTDDEHAGFWRAVNQQLGKPYSDRTIIGDILDRDLGDRRGFDCSALCGYALARAHMLIPDEIARERLITPDWLYGYAAGLRRGRYWVTRPTTV